MNQESAEEEDTSDVDKEDEQPPPEQQVQKQVQQQQEQIFQVEDPSENHFVLEVKSSKSFRQANAAEEKTYRAFLKNPSKEKYISDLLSHIKALFETLLNVARQDYGENGVIRIYIRHPKLQRPIIVTPTYLGFITTEMIMEYIDNVLYSSGEIPADDGLEINVATVKLLKGSGRKHITNIEKDILSKRSLVKIRNYDNSCLPRAIVVGYRKLLADGDKENVQFRNEFEKIRDHRRKFQETEALNLRHAAGIPSDRAGHIGDIIKYENYLKVSIVVISAKIGNKRVYNGCPKYDRKIFLYHTDTENGRGHFDTITRINAMMCTSYYCNECGKGFKNKTQHKCRVWCNVCGRENCVERTKMKCFKCNKTCRSKECLVAHKAEQNFGKGKYKNRALPSLCEQFWECPECGVNLKREKRDSSLHECGEIFCKVCKQYFMDSDHHICYLRAKNSSVEPEKFIYYDFECTQQDGKHIPNFVVTQSVCSKCENNPVTDDATCVECGSRCNYCKKYNSKEKEYEREPCNGCAKRQRIFSGENTLQEFCKWLIDEQHKNFTCIAHNSRAYDAYFIYDYLMRNSIVPEPAIFNGSKLMYMQVGKGFNIRIIDSLNFLPMPLACLPKSFGLEEIKKGFFPHFYNTPEHWNDSLDELPDMSFYGHNEMSIERRKEFLTWYEKNKNNKFDFQKEMKEYCISDVDILLKACCKFRDLLRKETGEEELFLNPEDLSLKTIYKNCVDPFSYLTIASVCMGVFRSKFLQEKWEVLTEENEDSTCNHEYNCSCTWLQARKLTSHSNLEVLVDDEWLDSSNLKTVMERFVSSPIGLIPVHGYSGSDNHSKESIEWLTLLERQWFQEGKPVRIQHARNDGEKIVTCRGQNRDVRYRVDGFFEYCGEKYVCEYNGCNFHGCLKCFPRDRESTMNDGKSMAQRFRESCLKERRLKEAGYNVILKWSCDFAQEKKQPQNKDFLKSLNIQDPINVRDCYFGGRTNGLILHRKFDNGEKGYYVDFTSLYPDVLKYQRFPLGHPEKIGKEFDPIYQKKCEGKCPYEKCSGYHWAIPYFGVMKATFLPPTDILHPILPLKCDEKLKFPLCYKCACKNTVEECTCSDSERSFTHTYCTPEIEIALNEGYKIVQIHEVLHWKESEVYDPQSKSGGLFTGYINTFLRLKQQASGLPEQVKTDQEVDEYVQNYFIHEGINLDKNSINKNPGLRSLSKLALNSFYGKFGQRTNMNQTKFVTDIAEMYKLLTDPSIIVTDFHIMNENVIEMEYKNSDDFEPQSFNTNVVIAAFCTSWARLKLWAEMKKLGSRVVYHDTDSIIFSVKHDTEYVPPLGEYLGDLTNELTCKELGCKIDNCCGHWIEEFVSCGPKNYTYKVNTGEIVCKVRGFSLNHKASLIINFDTMKDALKKWMKKSPVEIVTVKTEIRRNKHDCTVYNTQVNKKYGVVYDKRRVFPDFTTLPFGYRTLNV